MIIIFNMSTNNKKHEYKYNVFQNVAYIFEIECSMYSCYYKSYELMFSYATKEIISKVSRPQTL